MELLTQLEEWIQDSRAYISLYPEEKENYLYEIEVLIERLIQEKQDN